MAFTKEFNIQLKLILLLDYKVHTTINIKRHVELEVVEIEKDALFFPSHPYQKHHRYAVYLTCPQPDSVHFNRGRRQPAHENHTTDGHTRQVLRVTRHWIGMNGQLQVLNASFTSFGVHCVGRSSGPTISFCLQVLMK